MPVVGADVETPEEALAAAGGSAKVAIVALLAEIDADEARARLDRSGDHIQAALEP